MPLPPAFRTPSPAKKTAEPKPVQPKGESKTPSPVVEQPAKAPASSPVAPESAKVVPNPELTGERPAPTQYPEALGPTPPTRQGDEGAREALNIPSSSTPEEKTPTHWGMTDPDAMLAEPPTVTWKPSEEVKTPSGQVYQYTGTPSSKFAYELYAVQQAGKEAQARLNQGGSLLSNLGDVFEEAGAFGDPRIPGSLVASPLVSVKRHFFPGDKELARRGEEAMAAISNIGVLDPTSRMSPEAAYRLTQETLRSIDPGDVNATNAAYGKLYAYYLTRSGISRESDLKEQERIAKNGAKWATNMLLAVGYFGELPIDIKQIPTIEQKYDAQWRDLLPYPREGESYTQAVERSKGAFRQVGQALSPQVQEMPTGRTTAGESTFDYLMRLEFALGGLGLAEFNALQEGDLTPKLSDVLHNTAKGEMALGAVLENKSIQEQLRSDDLTERAKAFTTLGFALLYDLKTPTTTSAAAVVARLPQEYKVYRTFFEEVQKEAADARNAGKSVSEVVRDVVKKSMPEPLPRSLEITNPDEVAKGAEPVYGIPKESTSFINRAAERAGLGETFTNPLGNERLERARETVRAADTAKSASRTTEELHAKSGNFFRREAPATDAYEEAIKFPGAREVKAPEEVTKGLKAGLNDWGLNAIGQEYLNRVAERMSKDSDIAKVLRSNVDLQGELRQGIGANPLVILQGTKKLQMYKAALASRLERLEAAMKESGANVEAKRAEWKKFLADFKERAKNGAIDSASLRAEYKENRERLLSDLGDDKKLGMEIENLKSQMVGVDKFETAYTEASEFERLRMGEQLESTTPLPSYFEKPPAQAEKPTQFAERGGPPGLDTDALAARRKPSEYEHLAIQDISALLDDKKVPESLRRAVAKRILEQVGIPEDLFPANYKDPLSRLKYVLTEEAATQEAIERHTEGIRRLYERNPFLSEIVDLKGGPITSETEKVISDLVRDSVSPETSQQEIEEAQDIIRLMAMTGAPVTKWQEILPEIAVWQRQMRYGNPASWSFALMGEYYAAPGAALKGFKGELLLPRAGEAVFKNWAIRVREATKQYLLDEASGAAEGGFAEFLGASMDRGGWTHDDLWAVMTKASEGASDVQAPSVNAWFRNRLMHYGASKSGVSAEHILQGDLVWVRDEKAFAQVKDKKILVPSFITGEEQSSIYVHPRTFKQGRTIGPTLITKSKEMGYGRNEATARTGFMARVEKVNPDGTVQVHALQFERHGSPRHVEVPGAIATARSHTLEYMERGRQQYMFTSDTGRSRREVRVLAQHELPTADSAVPGVKYQGPQTGRFVLMQPPEQFTRENFMWQPEDIKFLTVEEFNALRERMVAEGVPDVEEGGRIPFPRKAYMLPYNKATGEERTLEQSAQQNRYLPPRVREAKARAAYDLVPEEEQYIRALYSQGLRYSPEIRSIMRTLVRDEKYVQKLDEYAKAFVDSTNLDAVVEYNISSLVGNYKVTGNAPPVLAKVFDAYITRKIDASELETSVKQITADILEKDLKARVEADLHRYVKNEGRVYNLSQEIKHIGGYGEVEFVQAADVVPGKVKVTFDIPDFEATFFPSSESSDTSAAGRLLFDVLDVDDMRKLDKALGEVKDSEKGKEYISALYDDENITEEDKVEVVKGLISYMRDEMQKAGLSPEVGHISRLSVDGEELVQSETPVVSVLLDNRLEASRAARKKSRLKIALQQIRSNPEFTRKLTDVATKKNAWFKAAEELDSLIAEELPADRLSALVTVDVDVLGPDAQKILEPLHHDLKLRRKVVNEMSGVAADYTLPPEVKAAIAREVEAAPQEQRLALAKARTSEEMAKQKAAADVLKEERLAPVRAKLARVNAELQDLIYEAADLARQKAKEYLDETKAMRESIRGKMHPKRAELNDLGEGYDLEALRVVTSRQAIDEGQRNARRFLNKGVPDFEIEELNAERLTSRGKFGKKGGYLLPKKKGKLKEVEAPGTTVPLETQREDAARIADELFAEAMATGPGREQMNAAIASIFPKTPWHDATSEAAMLEERTLTDIRQAMEFLVKEFPPAVTDRMLLLFAQDLTAQGASFSRDNVLVTLLRAPKNSQEAREAVLGLTHELSHHLLDFLPEDVMGALWDAWKEDIAVGKEGGRKGFASFLRKTYKGGLKNSTLEQNAETFSEWFSWQASEYILYEKLPKIAEDKWTWSYVQSIFDKIRATCQQLASKMFGFGPWKDANLEVRKVVDDAFAGKLRLAPSGEVTGEVTGEVKAAEEVAPEVETVAAKVEEASTPEPEPASEPAPAPPAKAPPVEEEHWYDVLVRNYNKYVEEEAKAESAKVVPEPKVPQAPKAKPGATPEVVEQLVQEHGKPPEPRAAKSVAPVLKGNDLGVVKAKLRANARAIIQGRIDLERQKEAHRAVVDWWETQGRASLKSTGAEKAAYDEETIKRFAAITDAKKSPVASFGGPRTPVEVAADAHIRQQLDKVAQPELARGLNTIVTRLAEGWAASQGEYFVGTADHALRKLLNVRLSPKEVRSPAHAVVSLLRPWLEDVMGVTVDNADVSALLGSIDVADLPARERRYFESLRPAILENVEPKNVDVFERLREYVASGEENPAAPRETPRPWLPREGRVPGQDTAQGLDTFLKAKEDKIRQMHPEIHNSALSNMAKLWGDYWDDTRSVLDRPLKPEHKKVLAELDARNVETTSMFHNWMRENYGSGTTPGKLIEDLDVLRPGTTEAWKEALAGGTLPAELVDECALAYVNQQVISKETVLLENLRGVFNEAVSEPGATLSTIRERLLTASQEIFSQQPNALLDPAKGDLILGRMFLFGAEAHDTVRDLYGMGAVLDSRAQRLMSQWYTGTADSAEASRLASLSMTNPAAYRKPLGSATETEDILSARNKVFVQHAVVSPSKEQKSAALFHKVQVVAGKFSTPYSARQHLLATLLENISIVHPERAGRMADSANIGKQSVTSGLFLTSPGFHTGNTVGDGIAFAGRAGLLPAMKVEIRMGLKPILGVTGVSNIVTALRTAFGDKANKIFDAITCFGAWSQETEALVKGEGVLRTADGRQYPMKGLRAIAQRLNVNDALVSGNILSDARNFTTTRFGYKGELLRYMRDQFDHTSEFAQYISERRRYSAFLELIHAGQEPEQAGKIISDTYIDYRHNLHPWEKHWFFGILYPFWNFTKGNLKRFGKVLLQPELWSTTFRANRAYYEGAEALSAVLDDRDEYQFDVEAMDGNAEVQAKYAKLLQFFKDNNISPEDVARILTNNLYLSRVPGNKGASGALVQYQYFDRGAREAYGPDFDSFVLNYFSPDPSRLWAPEYAKNRALVWGGKVQAAERFMTSKDDAIDPWKFWALPASPDEVATHFASNVYGSARAMEGILEYAGRMISGVEAQADWESTEPYEYNKMELSRNVAELLQNSADRGPMALILKGVLSSNPNLSPNLGSQVGEPLYRMFPGFVSRQVVLDSNNNEVNTYKVDPFFESILKFFAFANYSSLGGSLNAPISALQVATATSKAGRREGLLSYMTGLEPKITSAVGASTRAERERQARITNLATGGLKPEPVTVSNTAAYTRSRQAAEVVLNRMGPQAKARAFASVQAALLAGGSPKSDTLKSLQMGIARMMLLERGVPEAQVDTMDDRQIVQKLRELGS